MEHAPNYNKNVENAVQPFYMRSHTEKGCAQGIGYAAGKQRNKAGRSDNGDGLGKEEENTPAHSNVAAHGKNTIFF